MRKLMTALRHDQRGFSLFEVLVVIMIVGVLAAIALPSLLRQKTQAEDVTAKADARNALSLIMACRADAEDPSRCNAVEGLAPGTSVAPTAQGFKVTAVSRSGNSFSIEKSDTGVDRSCRTPGGGCRADRTW